MAKSDMRGTLMRGGQPVHQPASIDYATVMKGPATALERLDEYGLTSRDADALSSARDMLTPRSAQLARVLTQHVPGGSAGDVERVLAALAYLDGE